MRLEMPDPFAKSLARLDDFDYGPQAVSYEPEEARRVSDLIYLSLIYGDIDEAHRLVDEFSRAFVKLYDETTRLSDVLDRDLYEPLQPTVTFIGDVLGMDARLVALTHGAEFVQRLRDRLYEIGFEWP